MSKIDKSKLKRLIFALINFGVGMTVTVDIILPFGIQTSNTAYMLIANIVSLSVIYGLSAFLFIALFIVDKKAIQYGIEQILKTKEELKK